MNYIQETSSPHKYCEDCDSELFGESMIYECDECDQIYCQQCFLALPVNVKFSREDFVKDDSVYDCVTWDDTCSYCMYQIHINKFY